MARRTVGRPRVYDTRTATTVRCEPELLDRLDVEAQRREVGRNWLIVRLIERGLATMEQEPLT